MRYGYAHRIPAACPLLLGPLGADAEYVGTEFTWAASTDANVTHYQLYLEDILLTTTTDVSYTYNIDLEPETEYNWWVVPGILVGSEFVSLNATCAGQRATFTTLAAPELTGVLYGISGAATSPVNWSILVYNRNGWNNVPTTLLPAVDGATLYRLVAGVQGNGGVTSGRIVDDVGGPGWPTNYARHGNSNGTMSFGGAPVSIVGGAALVLPALGGSWMAAEVLDPALRYTLVSPSIFQSSGTNSDLIWSGAPHNPDGAWSAGSPTKITVPTGSTLVQVRTCVTTSAVASTCRLSIRKNDTGLYAYIGFPITTQLGSQSLTIASPPLVVTPGDYFEVRFDQGSGNISASSLNWFSMEDVPSTYIRALLPIATQSLVGNTPTKLTMGTAAYDTGGIATSTGFTVPSGVTQAKMQFGTSIPTVNNGSSVIAYQNDSFAFGVPFGTSNTFTNGFINAEGTWIDVVPGDTLSLVVVVPDNTTLTALEANWFSVVMR